MLIEKSSSEKLLPAGEGNKYRDLEPDIIKQVGNFGTFSLKRDAPPNPCSQSPGKAMEEEKERM